MKITEVKTAFKIADVELVENSTKLRFKYLQNLHDEDGQPIDSKVLRENYARVYLVVVDDEIKKIWGSQAEGGIKQTLQIYQDGWIAGRPSIRSFGMWYFLYYSILRNKKIEFYMIYQNNFSAEIKGLFGYNKIENASYNYKLLEQCCITDYLAKSGWIYPDWNVQEQAGDWPTDVKQAHADITKRSLARQTSRGRVTINM